MVLGAGAGGSDVGVGILSGITYSDRHKLSLSNSYNVGLRNSLDCDVVLLN